MLHIYEPTSLMYVWQQLLGGRYTLTGFSFTAVYVLIFYTMLHGLQGVALGLIKTAQQLAAQQGTIVLHNKHPGLLP
jgi:hypothetical protein